MNGNKPQLYLMVGVPASGKSTAAKKLMDKELDMYISRDEVRFEMVPETAEYFSRENDVYNEWIKRIAWSLNAGFNVWADATHLNPASRMKTYRALCRAGIDFKGVDVLAMYMNTPMPVCKARNTLREGRARVPDSAMNNMINSYHIPTEDETWIDKIYSLKGE